jgi:hypothetical protein
MKKFKSVEIGGQKFKIKYVRKLNEQKGAWGFCEFDQNVIELCDQRDCTEDLALVTLCHELIHSILFTMGEVQLSKDEKFVDLAAHLSAQVIKSLK